LSIGLYCLHYLTQALQGINGAIVPENLTLYMFTLSHSSITRDVSGDRTWKAYSVSVYVISLKHYWGLVERSHLKTLLCICLRYLTQPLLGITGVLLGISGAIAKRCCKQFAPEKLTLYLFTLSHSSITRDYWSITRD